MLRWKGGMQLLPNFKANPEKVSLDGKGNAGSWKNDLLQQHKK